MRVLVVGGAGYIGSHVVLELLDAGHQVVVLDNLAKGHRRAVDPRAQLVVGDCGDAGVLEQVFSTPVDAVMHFAAFSLVGESVQKPADYYRQNVVKGLALLEAMLRHGVRQMVFSSTAAVYGEPATVPIPEDHPTVPTNPYGNSKLAYERVLADFSRAYGLRYASLRYFNAAGADPQGRVGEDHDPETHLIPLVLAAALGKRPAVEIFGTDYPTPDGTCIRDYIHVTDLAAAHRLALDYLSHGGASQVFNLGNGQGVSVRQVVETAEEVVGHAIPVVEGSRRPGDPARLVASSERAMRELGWEPRYADLRTIVATAWQWHRTHPEGFAERKDGRDERPLDGDPLPVPRRESTIKEDGRYLLYYHFGSDDHV